MDRDTKSCGAFRAILKDDDVKPLRPPPRSPDLNAHLERHFRSLKDECLSRMIFFGEKSLRRAADACLEHYHAERITRDWTTRSSGLTAKSGTALAISSVVNGLVACCDIIIARRREFLPCRPMNGFATEIYVAPESQRRTPIDPSKAVSLSAEIRTPAVALAYKILVPEASFSFLPYGITQPALQCLTAVNTSASRSGLRSPPSTEHCSVG